MKDSSRRPRWDLDVEALVALDTTFLGRRLVIAEFAIGVAGAWILGLLSVRAGSHDLGWPFWLGVELLFIGLNYLPLLILAMRVGRDENLMASARRLVTERPAEARRFGLLQAWIVVPLAVVVFAVLPPATSTFARGHSTGPVPPPPSPPRQP